MQPIEIRYHGVEASDALNELIQSSATHLERFSDRIQTLRVLVEASLHHHHKGNHYLVRLELRLPDHDLVVGHDEQERTSDEDPYQAVRHAFDAMRRKLIATQTQRQGRGRGHETIRATRDKDQE